MHIATLADFSNVRIFYVWRMYLTITCKWGRILYLDTIKSSSRYTKIFIAIKKMLHRDEKKHLIPALYATSAVFVKFFVKIFPQKLRI